MFFLTASFTIAHATGAIGFPNPVQKHTESLTMKTNVNVKMYKKHSLIEKDSEHHCIYNRMKLTFNLICKNKPS